MVENVYEYKKRFYQTCFAIIRGVNDGDVFFCGKQKLLRGLGGGLGARVGPS